MIDLVKVHFLRDLFRDGQIKLVKCAGKQNVSDALTKSLPRPAFEKHKGYMLGTRVPFAAFYTSIVYMTVRLVGYKIKLSIPFSSKRDLALFFAGG